MHLLLSYSRDITAGNEGILESWMCPGVSDYSLSILNQRIWEGLKLEYNVFYGKQYHYHDELIKAFIISIETMFKMQKGYFNTEDKMISELTPLCEYVAMCHTLVKYAADGKVIYAVLNMTANILLNRYENVMLLNSMPYDLGDYIKTISMMFAIMQSKLVLDNRIL